MYTVIDIPGIVARVVTLVKSEQRKLVTVQAMIEDRYQQIVAIRRNVNPAQSRSGKKGATDCPPTSSTITRADEPTQFTFRGQIAETNGLTLDRFRPYL